MRDENKQLNFNTMTNKKLLEAIAGYLPYDVKAIASYEQKTIKHKVGLRDLAYVLDRLDIIEFKLILHPLTDLTKPFLECGKVPIVELAKLVADIYNDDLDDKWTFSDTGYIVAKTPWNQRIEVYYKTKSICWSVYDMWNHKELKAKNQLKAFQWLYKHHFDVEGLIEKGYAIDINTLNDDSKAI